MNTSPKFPCIYCGQLSERGTKGEHVVPDAIRGTRTLLDYGDIVVCETCNGGVLSMIDRELCSHSPISVAASQVIDGHLHLVWDVDHTSNNMLIEAKPAWAEDLVMNNLHCYPQIAFESKGHGLRGDMEEVRKFGWDDFVRVVYRAARHCFRRYESGDKRAIFFEHIDPESIYKHCRLPPRVFFRKSIAEIARAPRRQKLILRYIDNEDKKYALYNLSLITTSPTMNSHTSYRGSYIPRVAYHYNVREVVRALMKIGLNLVAAYCPNTPVNRETFSHAIRVIRGEAFETEESVLMKGFVRAQDVQEIKGNNNEHSFRLAYNGHSWHIWHSYFGGKVGAYSSFPGPNKEKWKSIDIVAPLNSKEWTHKTYSLMWPINARITWTGMRDLVPSFKLRESEAAISAELVPLAQARTTPTPPLR